MEGHAKNYKLNGSFLIYLPYFRVITDLEGGGGGVPCEKVEVVSQKLPDPPPLKNEWSLNTFII